MVYWCATWKRKSGDHGFGGSGQGDIGTQPDKLHVHVVNEGLRWVLSWGLSPQCAQVANMNNNHLQFCITSLFFAFIISCMNDTKLTTMISYRVWSEKNSELITCSNAHGQIKTKIKRHFTFSIHIHADDF